MEMNRIDGGDDDDEYQRWRWMQICGFHSIVQFVLPNPNCDCDCDADDDDNDDDDDDDDG